MLCQSANRRRGRYASNVLGGFENLGRLEPQKAGYLDRLSAEAQEFDQFDQLAWAAKSAILPPLGLMQLGMAMLCSVNDKESALLTVPSEAIVIFEDDPVGVEGRVECREEGWVVDVAEEFVTKRVCEGSCGWF